MTMVPQPPGNTTLVYLARGADDACLTQFEQFVRAYTAFPAGLAHDLAIIFKGFPSDAALDAARDVFACLPHREIHTDDLSFDIGAYAQAARLIDTDRICFLNTNSEPAASNWLLKLAVNLDRPGVGLVGATGSFQTHLVSHLRFPAYPNLHVRTNAFMMRTEHARRILSSFDIREKWDAYLAECGPHGVTRQIMALGLAILVVGRNGRGYPPHWWSSCEAYHQGDQTNLLVRDNQTYLFTKATWQEKKDFHEWTWRRWQTSNKLFAPATP